MAASDGIKWRTRVRSIHVVWALIALIVLSACGSTLVGSEPQVADGLIDTDLFEAGPESRLGSFSDAARAPKSMAAGAAFATDDEASGGRMLGEAEVDRSSDDALIVRTATLELEVEDVAAVLLDARAEMTALGGYVAGSDEYDQGDRRWASVTYRIPVDRFTEALDSLRGLSDRVVRESTQSQEVTATVVDLDARISNLHASEDALVQIMDRSGRIEDVLAVQLRLEDVRGQIERLQAQRDNLADRAALSTLQVTWFTPVAAVTAAQEGWDLATEVDAALAQTVQAFQGVASLGVWAVVVGLPLLGIPVLLALVAIGLLRRRLRRGDSGSPGDPDGPDGPTALTATAAE